ncbi:MAG: hypothetical protein A2046_01040 [Bacteroidetes bacterium GWA2_30_7]|nr:MAG: hypothetical protein A2046_01040 [Bacteroidetes bacterium GWA2_30_7]
MKFKEVEISAFRIFDNPKNATFNFSSKSGEIANFVSLYAPNGFGKTSFYDAVEWGITNNIHRFWQNEDLTNKSIDALGSLSDKQIKLWRNTSSSRSTYVKITTDEKELPKRELKVHGRSKIDISNSDKVENKQFRQVILSQEWISAFLKEVNGEYRYKKFMENPDLKDIDNYFKNIKTVINICYEKINSLKTEIENKKEQVKDVGDNNLLEEVNNQISLLKKKFDEVELLLLNIDSTKEDIKKLKDFISKRVVNTNRESILMKVLDATKAAKVGDENTVGINLFYELFKHLNDINLKIINIKNFLKKFEDSEKFENELSNYKKRESELRDNKKKPDDLIKQFDGYFKIKNDIDLKQNAKNELEKGQPNLATLHGEYVNSQLSSKSQIDILTQKVAENKNKLAEIPHLKEDIDKIKTELTFLEDSISTEQKDYNKLEIEVKKDSDKISEILKLIEEIKLGEYHLFIDDSNNDIIINLIKGLEQKNKDKRNEILNQKEISNKIKQQQELNSTIQEFIKSGLAIVNERQTSVCPLCEKEYDSYTFLADRISNNKALSNILQVLMQDNNSISQKILTLSDEIEAGHEKLIKHHNAKLDILNSEKKEKENQYGTLSKTINENLIKTEQLKSRHSQISVQMDGLSIEEYENKIKKDINELLEQSEGVSKINSDLNKKISKASHELLVNKEQIVNIEKEIKELEKNEKYISITHWFNTNYPDDKVELEILTNTIKTINEEIGELNEKSNIADVTLKSLKNELISFNKDNLLVQLKELELKKNDLESKIEIYKHFIKENLNIEVGKLSQEELSKILNSKEADFKSELKKVRELHDEYQRLEKYCENIYEFLQSEKSKQELKNKQKELSFLNNKVRSLLEREKNKTQQYLEQKVKEFFYEELINDLYKKIDPHPDFKSVEFRPDFDAENPTLNVFVRNSNDDEVLIPNLYFSTAQINILSLSIFLASALHSTEYDCIFVDDPIQSMDSINVLSTIDLFRSIVVNNGKQIILSTHDENFHNLLKKKMPPNLFKSKFLELETFGKVKKDSTSTT